jgi:hypothetical protein
VSDCGFIGAGENRSGFRGPGGMFEGHANGRPRAPQRNRRRN